MRSIFNPCGSTGDTPAFSLNCRIFLTFRETNPTKTYLPGSLMNQPPPLSMNQPNSPPTQNLTHSTHTHESPSTPVLPPPQKKPTRWWGFFDADEEDALLLALWRFHGAVTASKVFSCSVEVDLRWPPGSLWLGTVEVQQKGPLENGVLQLGFNGVY